MDHAGNGSAAAAGWRVVGCDPLGFGDGDLGERTRLGRKVANLFNAQHAAKGVSELVAKGVWSEEDLRTRIPVLCHQRHVTPVAVCRMCSVHISSMKRGKLTPGAKFDGPAIVTEFDSTTVVLPGYTAEMDRYFNILINPNS
mgnify:CR=1 FL=1